jgi:NAD(P)-dependent dehydrogenase (short-subunit alcohol dehydrogenase family)
MGRARPVGERCRPIVAHDLFMGMFLAMKTLLAWVRPTVRVPQNVATYRVVIGVARLAVVTGARGIGFEVGRGLALAGTRVVFGVRDPAVGERATHAIRAEFPDADVQAERLDLADLGSVDRFGEQLRTRYGSLDVLVNNAGVVMVPRRQITADGFESHFGTNHLGHFALTARLLPLLRAAVAPRVVVVGSLAHRWAKINFRDLHGQKSYRRSRAYGQSKLANLLFMVELQRRSDSAGWGLTSVGAHPGFANTEAIVRSDDPAWKRTYMRMMAPLVPTAQRAARPIVFAATSPDVTPAGYYGPTGPGEIGGRVGPAKLAARARKETTANELWAASEELVGLTFGDV